ncbi:MAG: DUF2080 family transposase-associated protein [archaeon]
METEEKIIRKVTEIGNGAHIFAPKEWLDDEVILVRIPKKNAKDEAMKLLYPHLDKIIAAFIYGSHARNENDKDSDLDIFVISSEKFNIKSKDIEIIVVPEDKIELAKKLNPILFYSMIREAKPLINSAYLDKLKNEKIKFNYFKSFIEETKDSIESDKSLIDLDKKIKNKYSADSVIYSLILRLRGVFIINMLLNKEAYSKKKFRDWVVTNSDIDYEKVYKIYRAIRDDKKVDEKVPIGQAESLMDLLDKGVVNLKKEIK